MKNFFAGLVLLLAFLVSPSFAAEVKITLPAFDVMLNGTKIENENRQVPLLVYKDITYVPMTYYDCRYLGLISDWNNEANLLSIEKSNITCAYRDYGCEWKNENGYEAKVCDFNVLVNNKLIDNSQEKYPLLTFRDITYFPLTWRFAVEEFGWNYSFDIENGLVINSDNYHTQIIDLPNCSGMFVTDGLYYYYNGKFENKNVIYRVPVDDTSNPEIIHEVLDSAMSKTASLEVINEEIYIHYLCGSGPTMSTEYYYKIEDDGTITRKNPGNYSGGKHGYSEVTRESEGIFVKFINEFFDSPSKIVYSVNDVETEVKDMPGRIKIGRRRNGEEDYSSNTKYDCIQIYNGKIYYTAIDLDKTEDSALYCIDTLTGKNEKVIDSVWGFYVYNGWSNEKQASTTMIIYDSNGSIMRYEELTGNMRMIEKCDIDGMVLAGATGNNCIYTTQKTLKGDRTIVKAFGDYANGYSSINGLVIGDTQEGTYTNIVGDKLIIRFVGEAKDGIRLLIVDETNIENQFNSADNVDEVFVHDNTVYYMIENNTVVKVDL